jgi:hypothetical protein
MKYRQTVSRGVPTWVLGSSPVRRLAVCAVRRATLQLPWWQKVLASNMWNHQPQADDRNTCSSQGTSECKCPRHCLRLSLDVEVVGAQLWSRACIQAVVEPWRRGDTSRARVSRCVGPSQSSAGPDVVKVPRWTSVHV